MEFSTGLQLVTSGFVLSLEPVDPGSRVDSSYFEGEIVLTPNMASLTQTLRSRAVFPAADLRRLCTWLTEHVARLLSRSQPFDRAFDPDLPTIESTAWVPLDLSVELRCLEGEVEEQDGAPGGSFTLVALLNVGVADRDGTHVYAGAMSIVDVDDVFAFCEALNNYLHSAQALGSGRQHI